MANANEAAEAAVNTSGSTFWMPPQRSTIAGDVDVLFDFIYWLNVVFFLLIAFGTIYFVWKYRRKSEDQLATSQVAHNTSLEALWTFIPLVLVLALFVWGFRVFLDQNVSPQNAFEVRVTGEKWLWNFQYPNGQKTINELHAPPPGHPTKLVITSKDVLHSFFVPAFRVKMDAVPGRYTTLWFEPTEPGTYQIFCTEYCGTGHSDMLGKVIVHDTMESFEEAMGGAERPEDMPLAEWGKQLYDKLACGACHSLDGSKKVGPSFKGSWGTERKLADGATATMDDNYIRESLMDPQAKVVAGFAPSMPTFKGQLSDDDIAAIIEFIKAQK